MPKNILKDDWYSVEHYIFYRLCVGKKITKLKHKIYDHQCTQEKFLRHKNKKNALKKTKRKLSKNLKLRRIKRLKFAKKIKKILNLKF